MLLNRLIIGQITFSQALQFSQLETRSYEDITTTTCFQLFVKRHRKTSTKSSTIQTSL